MEDRHSEAAFESVIESHLLDNGYVCVDKGGFDAERAVFPGVVLNFIQDTQPKEWAKLQALHGERTGEQVLTDMCRWVVASRANGTARSDAPELREPYEGGVPPC